MFFKESLKKKAGDREFPSGPGVRTWHFHHWGQGSVPGWGTFTSQVTKKRKKRKKTKNQ